VTGAVAIMRRLKLLAPLLLVGAMSPAGAQNAPPTPPAARSAGMDVAPVPFGVGERLEYDVKYGIAGTVGKGVLEVAGIDTIRGRPSYHLDFTLKGGVLWAKVDDRMQSWLDVSRLVSHRFDQDQDEVGYERHRIIDFFPSRGVWERVDVEETGELATDRPLDDISFLYFVRTLPLEVGETYTIPRYWKDEGNPVTVKVLRRETVKLPAGTFSVIVVRPIIKTKGLFSEGGEAEVYFTDDDRRLLVQLKSKVSFGTLNLVLRRFSEGTALTSPPSDPDGPRS
jgi:hypothetical protein